MSYALLPEEELLRAGIAIVETIIRWGNLPGRALGRQLAVAKFDYKDPNNVARMLDSTAHNYAVLTLKTKFGDNVYIYGEEARTPRSLSRYRATVAIFDLVDGTDLVARGFSNWCSALVFFATKEQKVLAAVVGHGSGEGYYASSRGAFKKSRGKVRS